MNAGESAPSCLNFFCSPVHLLYRSPALFWPSAKMEAGGIEPPSRDYPNGGLYMLSRSFDLAGGHGERHSCQPARCFFSPPRPHYAATASLLFAARVPQALTRCRGCLNQAAMITGAAWKPIRPATSLLAGKLCSMFNEANERPRHATTTEAIRSKPVAPDGDNVFNHKLCREFRQLESVQAIPPAARSFFLLTCSQDYGYDQKRPATHPGGTPVFSRISGFWPKMMPKTRSKSAQKVRSCAEKV